MKGKPVFCGYLGRGRRQIDRLWYDVCASDFPYFDTIAHDNPMRCAPLFAVLLTALVVGPLDAVEREIEPLGQWDFSSELSAKTVGKLTVKRAGPLPPLFPDFDPSNTALALSAPAYVRLPDDARGRFQFDQGDAITVEAWVNLDSLAEHAYIIGKGRTASSEKNQNWAFRLRKRNGLACVNFLFRSRDDDGVAGDWHRWTSADGFAVGSGWHHVAIGYRFGQPESIRGFVDGKKVKGAWDMGGPTEQPPVVDDAEVWIGSAMGGVVGNSFNGRIDDLAVYRGEVADEVLQSRYHYVPQPIQRPDLPPDKVLAQLFGPFAEYASIPDFAGDPVRQWQQDTLAVTRIPFKYDSWGVRDDWTDADRKAMMLRAWTDITLEPGDYQLIVRSRGYSRLTIDDEEIVTTPKHAQSQRCPSRCRSPARCSGGGNATPLHE